MHCWPSQFYVLFIRIHVFLSSHCSCIMIKILLIFFVIFSLLCIVDLRIFYCILFVRAHVFVEAAINAYLCLWRLFFGIFLLLYFILFVYDVYIFVIFLLLSIFILFVLNYYICNLLMIATWCSISSQSALLPKEQGGFFFGRVAASS